MKQARNATISGEKKRVLITVPHSHLGGGVSNYFNITRNHFSIDVDFLSVGAHTKRESHLNKFKHLFVDQVNLSKLLHANRSKYDLVHINPSFNYAALVRDGLILRVAKHFEQKAIVFFHGWDERFATIVEKHLFRLFFSTYNKADAFVVLASEFKNRLRNWNFRQPIYLETTPVDNNLLNNFSLEKRLSRIDSRQKIQILFLSRIEKEKGILETIKACQILCEKFPDIRLIIAGNGSYMASALQFITTVGMSDRVSFLGFVKGEGKIKAFLESDIYVFPSYHAEGMPTSVLEAMAFGLPVVTRPVGGLKDFFVDGQHGFMNESKDPVVIASLVEKIICDKNLWKRMSFVAHEYAKKRFMASEVTIRLENIYYDMNQPV